jgi:hypothetical protein
MRQIDVAHIAEGQYYLEGYQVARAFGGIYTLAEVKAILEEMERVDAATVGTFTLMGGE